MKLVLDLPDARPLPPNKSPDRHTRPIGVREGRQASLVYLPRDLGLPGERRGKASEKKSPRGHAVARRLRLGINDIIRTISIHFVVFSETPNAKYTRKRSEMRL
jgi:hypothetical protein